MATKSKKSAKAKKPAKAKKARPAKNHGVLRGPKGRSGGGDGVPFTEITFGGGNPQYTVLASVTNQNNSTSGPFQISPNGYTWPSNPPQNVIAVSVVAIGQNGNSETLMSTGVWNTKDFIPVAQVTLQPSSITVSPYAS